MGLDYKQAGVDIDKADGLIDTYKSVSEKTRIPGVLGNLGGFSSLFSIDHLKMKDPVLVSGTDGIGTKLLIAIKAGIHNTIGIDLVAMCVNDIITCGAAPLFFLDYFASGRLDTETAKSIVKGIGEGCSRAGCALTGGETAELPSMYPDGEYDLAGFAVGIVDRANIIDGTKIHPGDSVIALAASGFHANGYSLVRKVIDTANLSLDEEYGLGEPLKTALLRPTILYSKAILNLIKDSTVNGIANITGGGIEGNASRILPSDINLIIDKNTWTPPWVFSLIQKHGDIEEKEMFRTFNMGIGMIIAVPEDSEINTLKILEKSEIKAFKIGSADHGSGKVILQ